MSRTKMLLATAGIVGLTFAGLATASAASASTVHGVKHGVSTFVHYTTSGPNATAGYFTSPLQSGDVFTHIEGFMGSGGTSSLENLGTGPLNAAGIGLCNQGNGDAVRMGTGFVNASAGTKEVIAAWGNLGTALAFGDPCANGAPAPSGSLTVTGLPASIPATSTEGALNAIAAIPDSTVAVGDTIDGQILAHAGFGASGCGPNQTAFEWQDLTTNPGVFHTYCATTGFTPLYNEGDIGVIGDTQGMAPPAVNRLADYAHVGLTELIGLHHGVHGSFQNNANWTAFPVFASTNGASSGSILLQVNGFKNDGTGVTSGTPVS